jgi:hypothetical protein
MNRTQTISRTIDLGYEQMLVLESRPHTRIRVLFGGIWLTEEGRCEDVFATEGEEVALNTHGLAVLEGLRPAKVEVLEPAGWPAAAGAFREFVSGLYAWVKAHVSRGALRSQTAA